MTGVDMKVGMYADGKYENECCVCKERFIGDKRAVQCLTCATDMVSERRIRYDLAYELADGIHTYHQCKCNRTSTRAGRCIVCLAEDLIELKGAKK